MRCAAMLIGLALAVSGCDQASRPAQSSDAAKPRATVELSSGQLALVKIGIAETYAFPVEVHSVGNVSFSDDPAIIQAESTMLGAAATYDLTRKELARVQSLGTTNGIAQKELEQAHSDEQTAKAAFKAARDAVRALGKTDAEIDNMVASGKVGSPANDRRTLKWVIANPAESDSSRLRAGQPFSISVPALAERKFEGTVSEVYATVDPTSHRVTLRAQVADENDELRPGMLVDTTIEVAKPEVAVGIPESGVVREGDGTMTAWVTRDGKHFAQRIVTTGLRENGRIQILEGLRQGEQVVVDGAVFLDNMLNATPND